MQANIRQRNHVGKTSALLPQAFAYGHTSKMNKKTIFSERLRVLMHMRDITQYALADKSGVPQPTIGRILSGETQNPKIETLRSLAKALAATESLELPISAGLAAATKLYPTNVSEKLEIKGKIPLISWVQAGTFCQVVDLFEPGDAEEWLPTLHAHGPHAYALRVDGDSMVNPNPLGKTYPPGCIVYVDPDMPITNGCRVIAKIPSEEKATFKMFVEDAGRRYLRPLNPAYPTIEMTEGMLICGVVVGKYEKE